HGRVLGGRRDVAAGPPVAVAAGVDRALLAQGQAEAFGCRHGAGGAIREAVRVVDDAVTVHRTQRVTTDLPVAGAEAHTVAVRIIHLQAVAAFGHAAGGGDDGVAREAAAAAGDGAGAFLDDGPAGLVSPEVGLQLEHEVVLTSHGLD